MVPSKLPVMAKRDQIKLASGDFDPDAQRKKTFYHRLKRKKTHEQISDWIPSVATSSVQLRGKIRQSRGHCLSYPFQVLWPFNLIFMLLSSCQCHAGTFRETHCGSNCSAQLVTGTSLTFWKSKRKQTLRTQTKDPEQKKRYIDLAAYFSFNGTCIQSQLEEKSWNARVNHEKYLKIHPGTKQSSAIFGVLGICLCIFPQEEAMSLAAAVQLIPCLQNKMPR